MKILRVEGENIASLYGPFSVNFEEAPLSNAGVFAICGPTGSGKSTLLDAMCLALYGRTPRLRGMRKGELMIGEFSATEARSLLSRGCIHGFAAVEFESALGVFRAEWLVEKSKRKLKDKTTKPADTRLFQIHGPDHKTLVDLKNREIAEFVGLDFEQFTRTVLLAQGEFRKFLDSTGDERSKLLERLTATQMYAEIGKAAYERFKLETQSLQNWNTQLQGIQCLEDTERQQKTEEHEQTLLRQKELRALQLECQNALRWYQTEQELSEREKQNKLKMAEILGRESQQQQAFQDLADWERCEPLRLQFLEWSRLNKESGILKDSLPQLEKREKELLAKRETLDFQIKDIQTRQSNFQERQLLLEKELVQAEALDKDLLRLRSDLDQTNAEFKRIQTRLHSLLTDLRKSTRELQGLDAAQIQVQLSALALEKERLRAAKESLEVYLKHRAVLQTATQETSGAIEKLRCELVRGTPCPVCGGMEHPATLHDPSGEMQFLETQSQAIAPKEGQLLQLQKKAAAHPGLQEQLREFLSQRKRIRPQLHSLQQQLSATETARKDLLQGQNAGQIRKQLQQEDQEIQSSQNLAQNTLRDTLREHAETKTKLESSVARHQEYTMQMEDLRQSMLALRSELGLSEDRGREILRMDAQWAQNTRQFRDQILQTKNQLEGSLHSLQDQLTKLREQPPSLEKAVAETQHVVCNQELELLDKTERELSRILEIDATNRVKAERLQQKVTEQKSITSRWEHLNSLIGSAEGDKFRAYAQNITLHRLTTLANKHLNRLHCRYKLQAWANMELVIEDLDMGGEIRSTRSLSGGEGFLVSMALALGLSDMAGKQVRIGSLFIDEGFGTLDSETLQTVVSVLEELRQQGRMVGIISHVEGLASQLGASIQILPQGNGRSRLEVC